MVRISLFKFESQYLTQQSVTHEKRRWGGGRGKKERKARRRKEGKLREGENGWMDER